MSITSIAFTRAGEGAVRTGLLGFVTCIIGETLLLDGITVRRTADGRLTLSFPARRDSSGRQHPYIRPLDDATRRVIEQQVFAALGIDQEASR